MMRMALLVTHTGRRDSTDHARTVAGDLIDAGFTVRIVAEEAADLRRTCPVWTRWPVPWRRTAPRWCSPSAGRHAVRRRVARAGQGTPPGINLGKVGFPAEAEIADLDVAVRRVVAQEYTEDERLTLDVTVQHHGAMMAESWALNEASVEKGARERMLEMRVDVDGRPLSRYGCDGSGVRHPDRVDRVRLLRRWPGGVAGVEALLLVPISAHALFSRPLVTAPASTITVTVDPYAPSAVLCCDGRRVSKCRRAVWHPPTWGAPGTGRAAASAAVHRPSGGPPSSACRWRRRANST